jgi:hypothetical protein
VRDRGLSEGGFRVGVVLGKRGGRRGRRERVRGVGRGSERVEIRGKGGRDLRHCLGRQRTV